MSKLIFLCNKACIQWRAGRDADKISILISKIINGLLFLLLNYDEVSKDFESVRSKNNLFRSKL